MLFLKLWAKNMQIIGRDNMTSYCLITMVIFFLQQPRQSQNQSTANNNYRIIKSLKKLQENCPFYMVQGTNYAYDLTEANKPVLPTSITTWDLIKEFFDFYQNFNFEDNIISPYYGKSVAKSDLTQEICNEYFKQLRTITQYLQGDQANNLQTDRCMCVQDTFCLNQNTAKNISLKNRQYIILCLKNAQKICENPNNFKLAQLYEQLLFETINVSSNTKGKTNEKVIADLEKLKIPTINSKNANNNERNLVCTIAPSKADLRAVASAYPNINAGEEILRRWCQHYVDAIATIMSSVYRIDMQRQLPTPQKQQKLDEKKNGKELNKSWLYLCTIDLWSNRCFQRSLQTSFMSYQLEQTERLYALRRQDSKFSLMLKGILNLNILPNYMGIDIQFQLTEGTSDLVLNKKSPLRKFFNSFKNTLQNFNFKEILNIDKSVKNC